MDKLLIFWVHLLLVFSLISSQASADFADEFNFEAANGRTPSRSIFWFPMFGLLVPGLPQIIKRQKTAGFTYLGVGAFGMAVALGTAADYIKNHDELDNADIDESEITDQQMAMIWGLQTYQTAGSLSLYHAFRTSVKAHHKDRFDFLPDDETPDKLVLAPFKFSYLLRPTTYVPLLLMAGLSAQCINEHKNSKGDLRGTETLFSLGISYNAGVGEESIFRGWMEPILYEKWGSPTAAHLTTALVFSAMHITAANPVPWPQFIAGYYLGWLTEINGWSITESIFLHAWWDVIAIATAWSQGADHIEVRLPTFQYRF